MDIEHIRAFCLSLPGTTEGIKWDHHLCFMVGEKIYVITDLDHDKGISLKVTPDEFDELVATDGIIPTPYMARNKWVKILYPERLSPQEWEHFITQSYQIIKSKLPKRLQREIDGN